MAKIPDEVLEAVAQMLWHRFAPDHYVEWPCTHADEYRLAAAEALRLLSAATRQPEATAAEDDGVDTGILPMSEVDRAAMERVYKDVHPYMLTVTRGQWMFIWSRAMRYAATAAEPVVSKPKCETFWLIEYRPGERDVDQSARWWNGTHWDQWNDMAWTSDANNAIKFQSWGEATVISHTLYRIGTKPREQMGWKSIKTGYGTICPTEHEFPTPPPKEPPHG